MRLQLSGAPPARSVAASLAASVAVTISVSVLAVPSARAEPPADEASATVRVYADDDRLTVISPAAHGQLTSGPIGVEVELAVDAVSAASVDVITAASPTAVDERRLAASLGLTCAVGPTMSLRAGGEVSHEHDYDAWRVGLGVVRELARRNTTVELRARAGHDHATSVSDPSFAGDRTSAALTAVVTQLVDRRTIVDVTVDGAWADGWHGSPYRRVRVGDPRMEQPTWWPEATPARRLALSLAVRGRRALGERWFASAIARGYVDDWAVHSATATLELRRRLSERTLLGVQGRGYLQDGADFWRRWQPDGSEPPRHRTADRTLGPMASAALELVGDRVLDDHRRRLTFAVGGLGLWFLDNAAQRRRLALTTTLSFITPL
jgi:hypothetical protein